MEFNESESRTCRFLRQSAGKISDVTYSLSAASSKVNLRTFYSFCLLSSFVVKQACGGGEFRFSDANFWVTILLRDSY